MGAHKDSTLIHVPYAWSYADSSARTGASGFVAGDVGKLALQEDDNSLWLLTATTPTWIFLGGGGLVLAPDYSDISGNDGNTDVTGAELEELTDGSETSLHSHAGGGGGGTINHAIVQGRLTLETGVAISTSDQSAKTTLYFTPHNGNLIGTYTDVAWQIQSFTEKSLSLSGLTADTNYDIFIEDSDLSLSAVAWTNATTRATALTTQNGVLVKSGDVSKRYLGTIRINSTGGQCEDTISQRYLWNCYNRVPKIMRVVDTTDNWTYATATWRPGNNSITNRVQYVCGVSDELIQANLNVHLASGAAGAAGSVGIGVDSTSANSAQIMTESVVTAADPVRTPSIATYIGYPGLGYHYLQWLEYVRSGTILYEGDGGVTGQQSGLVAMING